MPKPEPMPSTGRPLVSNASTLVLSGFLIAAAAIEFATDDAGVYVLACGLTGLLAWLGLESARERRAMQAVLDREADACRRLKKHAMQPVAPLPLNFDGDPLADFFSSSQASTPREGSPTDSSPQAG
jgi:hypothetical protein